MTLATHLWVLDPISIDLLWPVGRALIHEFSERDGEAEWTDKEADPRWGGKPGQRERAHGIGQGFCSMYDIDYMADGSLLHDGVVVHAAEWCEDPCEYRHARDRIAYYAAVRLDTAYGYRDHKLGFNGAGDLHASIVAALGTWLDSQNVRWCWENEFSGEIYQGKDGLDTLGKDSAKASAWFLTTALPAIMSDIVAKAKP